MKRKHLSRKGKNKPGPAAHENPEHWIFGLHAVRAALENPSRVCRRLVVTQNAAKTLADSARKAGISADIVDSRAIEGLLPRDTVHQGVALLAEPLPEPDLDSACLPQNGTSNLVVVLDQVTDPHNVGAILRSAAAFGARAVVTTRRHSPNVTGVLAKSASGALERIAYVRVSNLARSLDALKSLGYWTMGLDSQAVRTLGDEAAPENLALVFGAEGEGLRRLTAERCDLLVRLPTQPEFPSLNVSNAAAVALYAVSGHRR